MMRRALRVLAVLAGMFALMSGSALFAQDANRYGPAYYPRQVGTTWLYRAEGGRITMRVVRQETIGGVRTAFIQARIATSGGERTYSEHIGVTPAGVARFSAS